MRRYSANTIHFDASGELLPGFVIFCIRPVQTPPLTIFITHTQAPALTCWRFALYIIGADWQLRGQQKRVVTPGQNIKYHLAGALHSGTGKSATRMEKSKGLSLFIRLLKYLKATYQRTKTIMLIVDNYLIHKSRETLYRLKVDPKFRAIYQPVYSPWVNDVERLWLALHKTITRNHQYRSMWQLLKKVRHFIDTVSPSRGGKHGLAKV